MAVTIKDIAAAVGVSRGTVDRVINHRGGVSEEVAARVEQAVEEMGYLPNRAGRILAARKKPVTIGCLLPSDKITFFHDVIRGFFRAERELSDFGVSLRLKEVRGYDPEIHLAALRELLAENVSALCVATIETPEITALLNQTAAKGVPVAAINIDLPHVNRLFYIGSNYLAGGRTAGGLLSLMAKGPVSLFVVAGSSNIHSHHLRIEGFAQVMKEKETAYTLVDVQATQDDSEVAYEATKRVLQEHPEINYIYITTSGSAPGVCRALEELERKKRVTVIAFDDNKENKRLMKEGSIDVLLCQESFRQGYDAINHLFYYLVDGTVPKAEYFTHTVIKIGENL